MAKITYKVESGRNGLAEELQVNVGDIFQFDGSLSSDPENQPLRYNWTLLSKPNGSPAVLSDTASVNPQMTFDVYGYYTVRLIVNDRWYFSEPDVVTILAFEPNTAQWQMQEKI